MPKGKTTRSRSTGAKKSGKKTSASVRKTPNRAPLRAKSAKPRSKGGKKRNAVGGGVFGEAVNYTVAGFVNTMAAPLLQRTVGGFLPLGNFQQPVIFAGTGFLTAWVAGFSTFTRRFQRPLAVMGVAMGFAALFTPWVRKFFNSQQLEVNWGMSGPRGRRRLQSGIAAVSDMPPRIASPRQVAAAVGAGGGAPAMSGVSTVPGNRRRW